MSQTDETTIVGNELEDGASIDADAESLATIAPYRCDPLKPTKALRWQIAHQWHQLSKSEQLTVRAHRSQMGIACSYCGNIGYFLENCPNLCAQRPQTPDSDEPTPREKKRPKSPDQTSPSRNDQGIGLLWNRPGSKTEQQRIESEISVRSEAKEPKALGNHLDIRGLRQKSVERTQQLQASDAPLQSFEYFHSAAEGYNRSLPELTLHQVMRKLMRVLKKRLEENSYRLESKHDVDLLHPSHEDENEMSYPDKLSKFKEYQKYFIDSKKKEDRDKKPHKYKGSLRPIDSLDSLFRGEKADDIDMYRVDSKAGASMHSKSGWKSIMSTGDALANSDPKLERRIQEVSQLMEKQGSWVRMQKSSMERLNDRFAHCAFVLRQEMKAEHDRESRLLTAGPSLKKHEAIEIWKERLASSDRLMTTLKLYGFAGGFEEVDYLMYTIEKWRDISQNHVASGQNLPTSKGSAGGKTRQTGTGGVGGVGGSLTTSSMSSFSEISTVMSSVVNPYEMEYTRTMEKLKKKGVITHAHRHSGKSHKRQDTFGRGFIAGMKRSSMGGSYQSNASKANEEDSQGQNEKASRTSGSAKKKDSNSSRGGDKSSKKSANGSKSQNKGRGRGRGDGRGGRSSGDDDDDDDDDESIHTEDDGEEDHFSNEAFIAAARQEGEAIKRKQRLDAQIERERLKKTKNFIVVHKQHQREIDRAAMEAEKAKFKAAHMASHIREGLLTDVANLAPALIPMPVAMVGRVGEEQLKSYMGDNIVKKIADSMVLADSGYTPQAMLPLYVRNTQIEKNGSTPGGDQPAQVMAQDRRYSHYIGRPLNRFEPEKPLVGTTTTDINEYGNKIVKLAPVKELSERAKERLQQKKLERLNQPISEAMIRLEFKPLPSIEDLYYADELRIINNK